MGFNISRLWSTLPSKPPSICVDCWEGPFAARLGLFHKPVRATRGTSGGYSYSTSYAQLECHAAFSCVWCQFLLTNLKPITDFDVEGSERRLKITVGRPGWARPSNPNEAVHRPPNAQEFAILHNGRILVEGYVHAAADDPAAPYIFTRSPVLDVGSPRALLLAQASIDECVHKHTRCIQFSPSSNPRLPSRLVDCTDIKRPRLVSTDGRRGKYLALSYVWGEAQPHQTTTFNVSAYSDGISLSVLPRTIRNAIYVTHTLRFQFLWIDSLCIIQDSDEEKLHELGRMHHVYRYAFLTLIAASARKVSEGFLETRRGSSCNIAFPFPCASPAMRVGNINLLVNTLPHSGPSYAQPRVEEPINARGWCLQEYYMSPRALIFASDTLRFRCQTTTQNVGYAYYNQVRERRLPHVLFLRHPPPAVRGGEEWTAVHRAWWDIVEDYSHRVVGTPSDKLVACGAIADAFRRVLRTDYLAGLWRDTLLQDLLWEKDGDARLERPATYRAPSWSWAAVDGRVKMKAQNYLDGNALAEVVRCTVVLKDPKLRFGQVTGGSLVLHAPLIRYDAQSRRPSSLETSMNDEADAAGITSAWLIPLWRPNTFWMTGLVVMRVDSDSPNTTNREVYRRVGKFGADPLDDLYADVLDQLVEVEII